jgi:hypothetical protein
VPATVTTVTTNWASELSWTLTNGVQTLSGYGYTNYNTETVDACMEPGMWTIQLFDTWGDGWSTNSYVEIDHEGTVIAGPYGCGNGADDFCTGSLGEVMSFWVGASPQAPPAPPKYPPGVIKHETCLFHIHTVVGGTAMQLAEVTMYDTYGNALSYPSTTATSDCEATGMEASKAVDGNINTKWMCDSGFSGNWWEEPGAKLTMDFDTDRHLASYQLTAADDFPERNPTSWTLTCTTTDGTDIVMSTIQVGDVAVPDTPNAQYPMISLLPGPSMPPTPPAPPTPPTYPPGAIVHEMCDLKFTGNLDGSNSIQFAELKLYDTSGGLIPLATASSDCAPVDGEGPMQAIDGNTVTKWLCAPFYYNGSEYEGGTVCDDTCTYPSDTGCDDGGPGAEYNLCGLGTDCSDCGPRGGGGVGATLHFEFDTAMPDHELASYTLTTANDLPGRDPTSWSLSCAFGEGNMTLLSVVEGMTPPTDRFTDYEMISLMPSPPGAPPMPPQEPSPPMSPPPPPPSPAAPCTPLTMTTVTTIWANEQTWTIDGTISAGPWDNDNTATDEACLEPGAHTIVLYDSWGDGWSAGSSVTIVETQSGATVIVAELEAGTSTGTFPFWVGDAPAAPPTPPPEPPAYPADQLHYVATSMTWSEAEAHCVAEFDGHLASIHTPEENLLVLDLCDDWTGSATEGRCWIGFNDAMLEGLKQSRASRTLERAPHNQAHTATHCATRRVEVER